MGTPRTPLTPDEKRVRQLLVVGLSGEEMAETLDMSTDKVREHIQKVLEKYQVHSRLELRMKTGGWV